MKRLILFLLLFLSSVFLCSCRKNEAPHEIENLIPPIESRIRIRWNGFETEGSLFTEEKIKILFRHEKEGSPLYGMEEFLENGVLTVRYGDLIWNSQEICTPIPSFFSRWSNLSVKDAIKQESEDGKSVLYQWKEENAMISLTVTKKEKKWLQIQESSAMGEIQIDFLPSDQNLKDKKTA